MKTIMDRLACLSRHKLEKLSITEAILTFWRYPPSRTPLVPAIIIGTSPVIARKVALEEPRHPAENELPPVTITVVVTATPKASTCETIAARRGRSDANQR